MHQIADSFLFRCKQEISPWQRPLHAGFVTGDMGVCALALLYLALGLAFSLLAWFGSVRKSCFGRKKSHAGWHAWRRTGPPRGHVAGCSIEKDTRAPGFSTPFTSGTPNNRSCDTADRVRCQGSRMLRTGRRNVIERVDTVAEIRCRPNVPCRLNRGVVDGN